MPRTHKVKIWPEYFNAVEMRVKTYEIRKNDRGYEFGDYIVLQEWDQSCPVIFNQQNVTKGQPRGYTGRELKFKIGYMLQIGGDTVVFSLLEIGSG